MMENYITDGRTGLKYELVGDYYLIAGDDEPEEDRPIGVWGQRHLRYLKEHRRVRYANLLTNGELNAYLADIDRQAEALFLRIDRQRCITEYFRHGLLSLHFQESLLEGIREDECLFANTKGDTDVFLRFVNLGDRTFSECFVQNNGAILNIGCDKLLLLGCHFRCSRGSRLDTILRGNGGFFNSMMIHRFFESLPAIRRGASDSRFRCAFVCIAARLFRVPAFCAGSP